MSSMGRQAHYGRNQLIPVSLSWPVAKPRREPRTFAGLLLPRINRGSAISNAELRSAECVANRGRGAETAGLASHYPIDRREEGRVEGLAGEGRWLAREVGAGRHQRPAERGAECDYIRMRTDPDGDALVRAGDPAWDPRRRGDDPGIRTGPAIDHGIATRIRQRVPVEQTVKLVDCGRYQDHSLFDRALF